MSDKKLLMEYRTFQFSKEELNESISKNNGDLVVKGILTTRDESVNGNGRVYPRKIIEREIDTYINEYVTKNRATGELDHADSSVINLKNVSHNIIKCEWEGDNLIGTIKILSTPSGNILKELFKCDVAIGISSRALGSVKRINENTVEVQDDLSIICFDFVSNPSCQTAWMKPVDNLQESIQSKASVENNKYSKVERLIHDILTEIK
jgi:hypothetical protein